MEGIPDAPDESTRLRRLLGHLETAHRVAGLGSWEWRPADDRLYWAPQVATVLGLPEDAEPSVARYVEAIHRDDRSRVQRAWDQTISGAGPFSVDHRIVRPDGELRYVRQEGDVVRVGGEVVGVVGVVEDRTDRVRAERRLREIEAQRTELLHRLLRATDRERGRLAAELHDGPIQDLTIAALQLDLAGGVGGGTEATGAAAEAIREVVAELRDTMFHLEPLALRVVGLEPTVRHLVSTSLPDVDTTISFDHDHDPPEPVSRTIVRIVQEAVDNVRAHARADHVEITVADAGARAELEVRDDGTGFDVDAVQTGPGQLGLVAMRERAEAIGGTVTVRSGPDGTTVRASLPHRQGGPT